MKMSFYQIFEKTDNHADNMEPMYSTEGSFCVDLFVGKDCDKDLIKPMESKLVGLGIKIKDDCQIKTCGFLLFIRSGLASKNGLSLANGVGVIDCDYKTEIMACIINFSKEPYVLRAGTKICQIAMVPRFLFGDLECNNRRNGGFGSTGL